MAEKTYTERDARDWQRAVHEKDKTIERLAEWARFVARQGCSGNARRRAEDPCPTCRAAAGLRAAGLEVDP